MEVVIFVKGKDNKAAELIAGLAVEYLYEPPALRPRVILEKYGQYITISNEKREIDQSMQYRRPFQFYHFIITS